MDLGGWRRLIELIGWMLAATAGSVMLTQAAGWNGFKMLAVLQALTPYAIVGTVPVAGLACWGRSDRLAIITSLIGVGGLVLAAPLVFTPALRDPDPTATPVTVAATNLLFHNRDIDAAADALLQQEADAIVFTEYTAQHQEALLEHPLASMYPERIDRPRGLAGGVAVWSRYPITERDRHDTVNYTLDVMMDGPNGPMHLVGVHPPTPIFSFDGWVDDLATFGELGAAVDVPTLIVGDFNASYWHPPFRDLLANGFVDAHTARGRGFSTSWPTDEPYPAFVRLDHALTGNGLVSTDVDDFTVPGSDHRGFVVTVVPAR